MSDFRLWKAVAILISSYICVGFRIHNGVKSSYSYIGMASDGYSQGNSYIKPQPDIRSEIPSRFDTCLLIVTGIIGFEPKETYLKNGHYVLNFPVAIVGHFGAVHEWERFKPTETMWLPSEVWDDLAKSHLSILRKGSKIRTVGTLLSNKWTDKNTGDERKQFKYRITKLLTEEELKDMSNILEINFDLPASTASIFSSDGQVSDSNFQSDFPAIDSQVNSGYYYADQAVVATPTTFNNAAVAPPPAPRSWNSRNSNSNNNGVWMNANQNSPNSVNQNINKPSLVAPRSNAGQVIDENQSWLTEDPNTDDFWFDR
jgi:single-stranded DNA-binding protein